MRTITTHTDAYKFDELSDDAKEKAIANLYDINISSDWCDSVYDDAKTIGCTIKEFDTGRRSYCKLVCNDAHETADLIIANHGETCDTRKLADEYLKAHANLGRDEDGDIFTDLLEDLDAEFVRALGEEYLSLLRKEYEYLTSEDAIVETIKANEYEFTEDGKLI